MHSPGINGEGELRGQLANPGSPGEMAVKTECVCVRAFPVTTLQFIRAFDWYRVLLDSAQ